jgi:hypothetical protein
VKKAFFWLLLLGSLGVGAWYCFHFPFRAKMFYRAIPLEAQLVTEHRRLAERCPALLRNEAVRALLRCAGVPGRDIEQFAASSANTKLFKRLTSDRTLVAYAPSLGASRQPAWVAATWVGGYSQVLKMQMTLRLAPGLERIRLAGGRQAWQCKDGAASSARHLSLAFVEGTLVVCLSPDPQAVRYVLQRMDAGDPILPELQAWLDREAATGDAGGALDRGWVVGYQRRAGALMLRKAQFDLRAIGLLGLEGEVRSDWQLPGFNVGPQIARPFTSGPSLAGLSRILGDFPHAIAALPVDDLKAELAKYSATGAVEYVSAFLRTNVQEHAAAFACLSGAEYGGRLFGFRTPALLAGVQMADPSLFRATIAGALDELNAKHRLGLIANTMVVNSQTVVVVEGLMPSAYRELAPDERVAFVAKGGWMICSSSLAALTNLAARTGLDSVGTWRPEDSLRTACGALWVDLSSAADMLTKSLAVHDLMTYAQAQGRPAGAARRQWDAVLRWAQEFKDRGALTARVTIEPDSPEPVLRFVVGESGGAP